MTRASLLAALGAAAAVAVVALLLLSLLGPPAPGASASVAAGPGPGGAALDAWRAAGANEAEPALPLAAAAAQADGAVPGAAEPASAAAPPAIVAGAGGQLAEAPRGLAGRAATRRGSPSLVPWDRVPVFGRATDLGKLGRPVARGLTAARERLRPCFAEERRALAEGREPIFDPADPPSGPAILMLELETRPGGVEVVSANVDSMGTSTPELASCAVRTLSGYAIDAPAAPAGKRFRLLHVLQ